MNVLNTTEMYTQKWLRWLILCYVYFTEIKKLKKCLRKSVGSSLTFNRQMGFMCLDLFPSSLVTGHEHRPEDGADGWA